MGLVTNHPLEKVNSEGLPWAVERNRYPSSIMVAEPLVAPSARSQRKTVSIKYIDDLACRFAAKAVPRNRHLLDGDCYPGLRRDDYFFWGFVWNCFVILNQLL